MIRSRPRSCSQVGYGSLRYGSLRAERVDRATPIGNLDVLIAAHALALETTLVTNNERDFRRVRGLAVEDWMKG